MPHRTIGMAIQPFMLSHLVTNPDCHFLAVLTALVQSILEGRTDCRISGVFGAGKTRAAAAMIAGLLVMNPTLRVMVVTKENAAAHAFAKHIESLQLPSFLEEKFGRLVGVTELEKGDASKTKLAVLRKLGTRILLPPALLSKQQDSPQLPQWIVNPFRTTQAHQARSVLFT